MLRGDDLPSFRAPRTRPPESKENSSDAKDVSRANPWRRRRMYSWEEWWRSGANWTFRMASMGPALAVKAADQSAVRPISATTNSRSSLGMWSRTNFSKEDLEL